MVISPKLLPSQLQRKLLIPQDRQGLSPQCPPDVDVTVWQCPLRAASAFGGSTQPHPTARRTEEGPGGQTQEFAWLSPNSDTASRLQSRFFSDLKNWSSAHFKYEKGNSGGQVCDVVLTHKHIHTACLMLSEMWRKGKPFHCAREIILIAFDIWKIPLSF